MPQKFKNPIRFMKRSIFIAFVFVILPLSAQQPMVTSEYNYRHYGILEGLQTEMVECAYQDSRGFLWFGTEHGVAHFDGFEFKTYLANKSFPVNKIEENERGEIIIYGYQFIYLLNEKTDKLRLIFSSDNLYYDVDKSPGLPKGFSLYLKRKEKKLVVCRFENDTLKEYFSHPALDKMEYGQSIFYDTDAKLFYIPTKDSQIYVVGEDGKQINVINNIAVSRFLKYKNELLAFGYDGVWNLKPSSAAVRVKFPKNIISKNEDLAVAIDDVGNFIIRDEKSVRRLRNNRFETIIDNVNIPRSLLFDREGNLWFTSRQGIYNFFKLDAMTYKVNAQNADIVNSILPVKNDEVYLGTGGGKFLLYNNNNFSQINYPQLPGSESNSFSYKPIKIDDALYFPTFGDILQYKNGKFRWLNIPPEIYHEASCRLSDKEFVVGGGNSLAILNNDGKLQRTILHTDIKRLWIYTVQADEKNRLWIGGNKGICCIGEKDSIYFFNENTLNAQAADKDQSGRVWICGESHIYYVEGDSLKLFMAFLNTIVSNLCCTSSGLIVVANNTGLKIIDPKTRKVVNYDFTNGYSSGEPAWNTMTEDFDGNIWLGTQSPNVLKFNPSQFLQRSCKLSLYITSAQFSVNNTDMFEMENGAKLNHSQHNVRFSFIGLCFSNPDNVRYRYRLNGFQEKWMQPTKNREVTFNNLAPGKYTFEVLATTDSDESTGEIRSFTFSIYPAFWQTWWFWTLCAIAFIAATTWIIYNYLNKKHFEQLLKIGREKEMNELRVQSVRLKSIPHFNSNVLAGIEYYIMSKSKEDANQLLARYSRFTNITLHEIDKAQRSLKAEIEYVQLYLDLEKMRFGDKFTYSFDIDENVDTKIMIPNMVLHTYAENAVKHGIRGKISNGVILIKAKNEKNGVLISVEDDGIGREESRRRDPERKGNGLGILTRQIELYNQQNKEKIVQNIIDLKDENANAIGTRFELYVPYEYKYL